MINYILLLVSLILGVTKNIIPKSGKKDFSGFDNLMSVNIITAIIGIKNNSIPMIPVLAHRSR